MKILFMGTPEFSVPTLKSLIDSKHDVIGVVTQPDKPKGRGNKMAYSPVKEVALKYNIPVYQPVKVRAKEFIEKIEKMQPEAIVVIAFGQILPKNFLDIPIYGCINIHASLLPKYRGSAPINWAVIDGAERSGITTMYMDVGIDTGDMLLKGEVVLEDDETGGSLHDKLKELGGPLILKTLDQLEAGTAVRIKQQDAESNYVSMLSKAMGNIEWEKPAVEIERLIRGLNPWPSAYSYLDGKILKIWKSKVISCDRKDIEPGTIYNVDSSLGIFVKCGDDALLLSEIQLQGKKRMEACAFTRGYHIDLGTKLG